MKKLLAGCCTAVMLFTAGCGHNINDELYSKTVFAMDTVMVLDVYGNSEILDRAGGLVEEAQSRLSVTDTSSEIYLLNKNKSIKVSQDTLDVINKANEISRDTDGALDISIYPMVKAWGFTTDDPRVPNDMEIADILEKIDYRKIETLQDGTVSIDDSMEIDLGGIAKGYTGDRLISLFRENGVKSAMINLGGNVQVLGNKPDGSKWEIGIKDPKQTGYIGSVSVSDKAVISSGGYERWFEEDGIRYHHIIDTKTGYPAQNGITSVTVIGDEGYLCDGLSTAFYVMGMEKSLAYWKENRNVDAVWYTEEGDIYITEGIKECFSLSNGQDAACLKVVEYD